MVCIQGGFPRRWRGWAVCLLGLAAGGCLSEVPSPATPDLVLASEDAHAAQIARGAALFAESCSGCHGPGGRGDAEADVPAIVGADALPFNPPEETQIRTLTFWTAADLFHFVRINMPLETRGRLSAEEHFAILAFVLHQNGIDLRGEELTLENASTFELHP